MCHKIKYHCTRYQDARECCPDTCKKAKSQGTSCPYKKKHNNNGSGNGTNECDNSQCNGDGTPKSDGNNTKGESDTSGSGTSAAQPNGKDNDICLQNRNGFQKGGTCRKYRSMAIEKYNGDRRWFKHLKECCPETVQKVSSWRYGNKG